LRIEGVAPPIDRKQRLLHSVIALAWRQMAPEVTTQPAGEFGQQSTIGATVPILYRYHSRAPLVGDGCTRRTVLRNAMNLATGLSALGGVKAHDCLFGIDMGSVTRETKVFANDRLAADH